MSIQFKVMFLKGISFFDFCSHYVDMQLMRLRWGVATGDDLVKDLPLY